VKRVLITTLIIVSLSQSTNAHPKVSRHFQSAVQASSKSQATDLAEAARLRASVLQLYNEGKYKEALPLAQQALRLRESIPGANAQQLYLAIADLGEIYLALKKYGDAESQFQRLIKIYEQSDIRSQ